MCGRGTNSKPLAPLACLATLPSMLILLIPMLTVNGRKEACDALDVGRLCSTGEAIVNDVLVRSGSHRWLDCL
jgi:hypothetical protein